MSLKAQERLAVEAARHGGHVCMTGADCDWTVAKVFQDRGTAEVWWAEQSVPARVWQVSREHLVHLLLSK